MVKDSCECVLDTPLNLLAYLVVVVLYVAMDDLINETLSLERKDVLLKDDIVSLWLVASASKCV